LRLCRHIAFVGTPRGKKRLIGAVIDQAPQRITIVFYQVSWAKISLTPGVYAANAQQKEQKKMGKEMFHAMILDDKIDSH
jgi:hypothetical protein